ncbi:MAG: hypothetical protein ACXWCW_25330 [Burkholderiales bacterium]
MKRALADPVLRNTLIERGLEPIGGTQDKLASHIRTEIAKYADIVRQAHIKID